MNKAECQKIAAEALKVLQDHFASSGVTVKYSGGSFGESATLKFEFVTEGGVDRAESDFRLYAESYGMSSDDFGKEFEMHDGSRYKISGLKTRASKTPILAKNMSNGKTYRFPATYVKELLAKKS